MGTVNLNLNAFENVTEKDFEKISNQQNIENAGGSAVSRTPDHLIKSKMPY